MRAMQALLLCACVTCVHRDLYACVRARTTALPLERHARIAPCQASTINERERALPLSATGASSALYHFAHLSGKREPEQCGAIKIWSHFVTSLKAGNTKGGNHCTVDLLFAWFGISCMTTDNFCFYLQNRLI